MQRIDKLPMQTSLGQLIQLSNWASRGWVDSTLNSIVEAIREAGMIDGEIADRVELAESAGDPAVREHVIVAALNSCGSHPELRTIGLRFMKLREQFRPIWSAETSDQPINKGGERLDP